MTPYGDRLMSGRCDTPGRLRLIVRRGTDGRAWLDALTGDHVEYSLAQAMWQRGDDGRPPRQLVDVHAAVVGKRVAMALVTDLTGDMCDFARSDHTCCTRMVNKILDRPRGTVWDNGGLHTFEVVGWEGVLAAIGQIAAVAAIESGTNDPYQSDKFFGPRRWGKRSTCKRPIEALSDRTIMPVEATLALIEPDVRPLNLSRVELIHEAEAAIDAGITRALAQLENTPKLRNIRPFHARKHGDGPVELADHPHFIGPAELVKPAAEEAEAWQRYYERCCGEFPQRQDVVFPAGTIRFRRLGAACDPFKPHRRAPCPPGSEPYRAIPPVYPENADHELSPGNRADAQSTSNGRAPPT